MRASRSPRGWSRPPARCARVVGICEGERERARERRSKRRVFRSSARLNFATRDALVGRDDRNRHRAHRLREAPTRPVRVIWHEVACPAAHQLDATELQVGKLARGGRRDRGARLPAKRVPHARARRVRAAAAAVAARAGRRVFGGARRRARLRGARRQAARRRRRPAVRRRGARRRARACVGAAAGGDVGRGRLERRARVAAGRRRRRLPARAAAALRAGRARRARLGGGARAGGRRPRARREPAAARRPPGGRRRRRARRERRRGRRDAAARRGVGARARAARDDAAAAAEPRGHLGVDADPLGAAPRRAAARPRRRPPEPEPRARAAHAGRRVGALAHLRRRDGRERAARRRAGRPRRAARPRLGAPRAVFVARGGARRGRIGLRRRAVAPPAAHARRCGCAAAPRLCDARAARRRRRPRPRAPPLPPAAPPAVWQVPAAAARVRGAKLAEGGVRSPPAVAPKGGGGERRSWVRDALARVVVVGAAGGAGARRGLADARPGEAAAWRPVYSCPLATPPLSPPGTSTSTPPADAVVGPHAARRRSAAARAGNSQPRRCLDSFV